MNKLELLAHARKTWNGDNCPGYQDDSLTKHFTSIGGLELQVASLGGPTGIVFMMYPAGPGERVCIRSLAIEE